MWVVEGLVEGIFVCFLELSESFARTSHTTSYSFSILAVRLRFWLACKEKGGKGGRGSY